MSDCFGQKDILKCRDDGKISILVMVYADQLSAGLHPAYLLRSAPAQKRLAFDDLINLAGRLGTSTTPFPELINVMKRDGIQFH